MLDAAPFLTRIKMTRDYSIYRSVPPELQLPMTRGAENQHPVACGSAQSSGNPRDAAV
jgi:hypothetical protein